MSTKQISLPWISSAEASPARTYPPPVSASGSPAPDPGSGTNTPASSESSAPAPSSSRTSPAASERGCPVCNTISCPLATAARPGGLELRMWGHHTAGCEPLSSPWATAISRDWKSGATSEATRDRNGRPLSEQVYWATPTTKGNHNKKGLSKRSDDGLSTQVNHWPTPIAGNSGSNRGGAKRAGPVRKQLPGLVSEKGRMLSARWVEALMGFPADWTATDGPPAEEQPSTKASRPGRRKGKKSPATRPASRR